MQYSLSNAFRIRPQITFPYSQDGITAGFHVLILRLIESHALTLSFIRLLELGRVKVPVVSIKLNNQSDRRHEGIDTEFICNEMLRQVLDANFIKNRIANTFRFSHLPLLLISVHFDEPCMPVRVFIGTLRSAVEYLSKLFKRRRFTKRFIAGLTDIFDLVSALPLICMLIGAKVIFSIQSAGWNIYFYTANLASFDFAIFTVNTPAFSRTIELLFTPLRGCELFVAYGTNDNDKGQCVSTIAASRATKLLTFCPFSRCIVLFTAILTNLVYTIFVCWQWTPFQRRTIAFLRTKLSFVRIVGNKWIFALLAVGKERGLSNVIQFCHGESSPNQMCSLEISGVGSTANLDQYPSIIPHFTPSRTASEATRSHVIYDPFLGSGMSLIAAENTNRSVIGCELSPEYIDVIITRWEKHTGQFAELLERVEEVANE